MKTEFMPTDMFVFVIKNVFSWAKKTFTWYADHRCR